MKDKSVFGGECSANPSRIKKKRVVDAMPKIEDLRLKHQKVTTKRANKNVIESKLKKPEEGTSSRSQMQNRREIRVSNARALFFSILRGGGNRERIFATEKCFFIFTQTRRAAEKEGMQDKKERIED